MSGPRRAFWAIPGLAAFTRTNSAFMNRLYGVEGFFGFESLPGAGVCGGAAGADRLAGGSALDAISSTLRLPSFFPSFFPTRSMLGVALLAGGALELGAAVCFFASRFCLPSSISAAVGGRPSLA